VRRRECRQRLRRRLCFGLRPALRPNAPHQARRRAALRPQPETEQCKNNQMPDHKKGTFQTR
jgi:hypothetical protein